MTSSEKMRRMLDETRAEEKNLRDAVVNGETKEERADAQEALDKVLAKIKEIEEIIADLDKPVEDAPVEDEPREENNEEKDERGFNPMATMEMRNGTPVENKAEERATSFANTGKMTIANEEARAVLVSSGKVATPTEVAGINDLIGKRVSSIIDLVKVTNAQGMGAYKVAYQVTDAVAGTQTEGEAYNGSEPTFDFVTITPTTEAVLSYISKQVSKQSPLEYEAKVNNSALVALRKRAAKIVTDKIVASELTTALADVTAIDEKALRKIALNYGGDESVVGSATLFLNKKDLVKFGDVRGTSNKNAVYEITPDASNPNTGIIKDGGLAVPYCIDSELAEGTILYGQGHCAELALFSDYEIKVSEDFAFDKGMLAIRGDVELGAEVVVKGGFVKVTIA